MSTLLEMRTKIKDYVNRSDLTDANLNDFINTAIRRAERDARRSLNYMKQKTTGTLTADAMTLTLPSDYRELEALYVLRENDDRYYKMIKKRMNSAFLTYPYTATDGGFPDQVAVDFKNSNFILRPTPDRAYTYHLYYWGYSTALSADADTHWIMTNHEEIIKYGALREAEFWRMNDERAVMWDSLFKSELKTLQDKEIVEAISGSFPSNESIYVDGGDSQWDITR